MYKKDFKKVHSLSKKVTSVLAMTTILTSSYYNQVFAATPALESLDKPDIGYYAELSKSLVDWNMDNHLATSLSSTYSLGVGAFYDLGSLGRVRMELGGFSSLSKRDNNAFFLSDLKNNVGKLGDDSSNIPKKGGAFSSPSKRIIDALQDGLAAATQSNAKNFAREVLQSIANSKSEDRNLLKIIGFNEKKEAGGLHDKLIGKYGFSKKEADSIIKTLAQAFDGDTVQKNMNDDERGSFNKKVARKIVESTQGVQNSRREKLNSELDSYAVDTWSELDSEKIGVYEGYFDSLTNHHLENFGKSLGINNIEAIRTNYETEISYDSEKGAYKQYYKTLTVDNAATDQAKVFTNLKTAHKSLVEVIFSGLFNEKEKLELDEKFDSLVKNNKAQDKDEITLENAQKVYNEWTKEAVKLYIKSLISRKDKFQDSSLKDLRMKNPNAAASDNAVNNNASDKRVIESYRLTKNRAIVSVNYDMNVQGIPKLKVHAGLGGGYGYASLESFNILTGAKIKELKSYSDIAVMYKAGLTYQISGPISINTEFRSVHDFLTDKKTKSKATHHSENQFVVGVRYEF